MKKLQMSLLENANDFLAEALSKAIDAEEDAAKWKFAILSLVQSIELVLKERLKCEHPALVYANVDKQKKYLLNNPGQGCW